jgi:hypothetical protein
MINPISFIGHYLTQKRAHLVNQATNQNNSDHWKNNRAMLGRACPIYPIDCQSIGWAKINRPKPGGFPGFGPKTSSII